MNNKICLVVSNCKSCWDTSSKLVFVSDSTPDYRDTEWLKTINHAILEGPWKSMEYHVILSTAIECYGIPWKYYGVLWNTIEYH